MYFVRVAETYRWAHARVAGRHFAKQAATPIDEATITDEILESPILAVEYAAEEAEAHDTDSKDRSDNDRRGRRRNGDGL